MAKKVLFVVEGGKVENDLIIKTFKRVMNLSSTNVEVVKYSTVIYDLYDRLMSKEYPSEYQEGDEPYFPVNNERNTSLYNQYLSLASNIKNIYFKGRLGEYKYYDMDDVILSALEFADEIL